jgi:hypothetical protein
MANRRGVQLGRAGRGCFGHTAISRRRHDHSTFDDPWTVPGRPAAAGRTLRRDGLCFSVRGWRRYSQVSHPGE